MSLTKLTLVVYATSLQESKDDREKVTAAFDKLKDINQKKISCLETMRDVTTLQQLCVV